LIGEDGGEPVQGVDVETRFVAFKERIIFLDTGETWKG
jgi:hypothetical protein